MPESTKTPPQHNHMELVGVVAAKWAYLEYYVDQAINMLMGGRFERTACLTANFPTIFPKLDALSALFHVHNADPKILKTVNKFKQGLYGTASRRSRIIHDPWFIMKNGDTGHVDLQQFTVTARGKPEMEMHPVPEQELLDVIGEIDGQLKRLSEISAAAFALFVALPENQPE